MQRPWQQVGQGTEERTVLLSLRSNIVLLVHLDGVGVSNWVWEAEMKHVQESKSTQSKVVGQIYK